MSLNRARRAAATSAGIHAINRLQFAVGCSYTILTLARGALSDVYDEEWRR